MTSTEDLQIVKIGTLYFFPVNRAVQPIDFDGFEDPDDINIDYGQPRLVCTSTNDQFHHDDDAHHWVVAEIPALKNGERRDLNDIIEAVAFVYGYLFEKGLTSISDYPGVIIGDPFDLISQPA